MAGKTETKKTGRQTRRTGARNKTTPEFQAPQLDIDDILDALPFYVILVDESHNIVKANRAVLEHLGVDPHEVVGKYCPQVIHGTKGPWYACPLEEAVTEGKGVVKEAIDKTSGRWINSAIYPIVGLYNGKKVFFHMVTDITERKKAEQQLKASREELSELSRHLESVREDERTSIAREIHDELGQTLVTLKVYLSWLLRRLPQAEETVMEQAKPMHAMIDGAIQTAMRLSTELRPGALDDLGLSAALGWQVSEFKKWSATEFRFTSTPRQIMADKELSTAIFRISHEALTNVMRHAEATKVAVSIRSSGGIIRLRIGDNGRGIEKTHLADPKAFGLIGMRERARMLGGDVKIHGRSGKGTVVDIIFPLNGEPASPIPDDDNDGQVP